MRKKSLGKRWESEWENLYYFIEAAYIYQSSRCFLCLVGQEIRIGFTGENAEHFISVIKSKGVKVSIHENRRRENTAGLFLKQWETEGYERESISGLLSG